MLEKFLHQSYIINIRFYAVIDEDEVMMCKYFYAKQNNVHKINNIELKKTLYEMCDDNFFLTNYEQYLRKIFIGNILY